LPEASVVLPESATSLLLVAVRLPQEAKVLPEAGVVLPEAAMSLLVVEVTK
jgi:hypothetical protein